VILRRQAVRLPTILALPNRRVPQGRGYSYYRVAPAMTSVCFNAIGNGSSGIGSS
jgi:hypothetical protein